MGRFDLRRLFKRPPPIWERPEWEQMTWEEKMALWKLHRRYNFILGSIFLVTFLGSITRCIWRYTQGHASWMDLAISVGVIVVMGICLYLAQNLMD